MDSFDHLDRAGALTAKLALGHRHVVFAALGLAMLLSWVVLIVMAAATAQRGLPGEAGPGGDLFRALPELPLPVVLEGLVAICLSPAPPGQFSVPLFGALWLMWMLMALAMMLPAAAPMVRTYCEIADTARARSRPVVHPLVLVAGYLAIWALAAAGFAAASLGLHTVSAMPSVAAPATAVVASAALAFAGLYQFSNLKEACLRKCRNPFAVLFSSWSDRPTGVFALGLRQGIWCLGCCWALMLVMFAVGIMNVFWMALIALLALAERQVRGRAIAKLSGAILLVWSVGLLLVSV